MKTEIDTGLIKQSTNLIELAGRYTQLKRKSASEWCGACPWCGGVDRFVVKSDVFFCRPSNTPGAVHCGRSGDVIKFVQEIERCDFVHACEILTGSAVAPQRPMVHAAERQSVSQSVSQWNEAKESERADAMHRSLMSGRSGHARAVMGYLVSRGLSEETIAAYRIGCRMVTLPSTWDEAKKQVSHPKQPSIAIPWFNHDGALVAVKYRFTESHIYTDIDGKQRTENKTSRGSMAGQTFGWQALRGSHTSHTLVICEGEINAMSIYQAGNGAIDVLSAGNESQVSKLTTLAIEESKQYKSVIVWADRGEIADSAARLIPQSWRFHSPVTPTHPKGMDANDALIVGVLPKLLDAMIGRFSQSVVQSPVQSVVNEDVLDQVRSLLDSAADWTQRRDARWVWRWREGYTDQADAQAKRNVDAAASRLGVNL